MGWFTRPKKRHNTVPHFFGDSSGRFWLYPHVLSILSPFQPQLFDGHTIFWGFLKLQKPGATSVRSSGPPRFAEHHRVGHPTSWRRPWPPVGLGCLGKCWVFSSYSLVITNTMRIEAMAHDLVRDLPLDGDIPSHTVSFCRFGVG